MHDIRALREEPEVFTRGWAKRGASQTAEDLLELDARVRALKHEVQSAQEERNTASKAIGKAMGAGDTDEAERLKARVSDLKSRIPEAEAELKAVESELNAALEGLPNLPADDVPEGPDESANVEVRRWGDPRRGGASAHFQTGEALGLLDFETAAKLSGSRFAILRGDLARLERAVAAFMLDLHTREHGYQEVSPPVLVRPEALHGTGQLPKFEEDLYATRDDALYLSPTAEVPLTNTVRGSILRAEDLPIRLTAFTPCFRREAGAAGRDTRGLIRLHQFSKVELVSITDAASGPNELERMTACAEDVLKRLDIAYRVMVLSTGDMGFSARKTYDLEVWLPGQGEDGAYREISSCSWCGAFQARRMDARYRPEADARPDYVHTLNGSALAVGRTLVAILENFVDEGGRVAIPEALRGYMGGATHLEGLGS